MAQIEERFPEQREPEADARMHPAARLEATLRRVSERVLAPGGERLVVLIDGLDEYDPPADTPGRDPLAAFLPARGRVACASCARAGRAIRTWTCSRPAAPADQTFKVWDLDAGRELATLQGLASEVTACAVTPDGRRVVSASWDRTLKVWDLGAGRELATLQGHAHFVSACVVTPDGRRVVSASLDKTLKVWDLGAGHELATLQGHSFYVTACAVTPDGRCPLRRSLRSALRGRCWRRKA